MQPTILAIFWRGIIWETPFKIRIEAVGGGDIANIRAPRHVYAGLAMCAVGILSKPLRFEKQFPWAKRPF